MSISPVSEKNEEQQLLDEIRFSSPGKTRNDIDRLNIGNNQIPTLMDFAAEQSTNHVSQISRILLQRPRCFTEGEQAACLIVKWASQCTDESHRRVVIATFLKLNGGIGLIQCISELPEKDAHPLIEDYFAAGGEVRDFSFWLQVVGAELRGSVRQMPSNVVSIAGWNPVRDLKRFGRSLKRGVRKIGRFVDNFLDEAKKFGKELGDFLSEAIGWTVEKFADLVKTLIEKGKSVSNILSEAVAKGTTLVKKTLRALQKLHNTVADIIDAAAGLLPDELKAVVRGLLKINTKVVDVIVNFANRTLDATQTALEALLLEGVRMMTVVNAICRHVAKEMRKGFFEGLIALGMGAVEILEEAAKSGAAISLAAFSVLLEIWGGYRGLNADEMHDARRIFGWSLDLDRVKITNGTILTEVAFWLNNNRPFTTMYVINFPEKIDVNKSRGILIHELTHVWQAANVGPIYMVEAIHSQFYGRGYKLNDQDIANAAGDLSRLGTEQQAVVVERYWRGRYNGERFDWRKYQQLARQVYGPNPRKMMIDLPLSITRLEQARANIFNSIR